MQYIQLLLESLVSMNTPLLMIGFLFVCLITLVLFVIKQPGNLGVIEKLLGESLSRDQISEIIKIAMYLSVFVIGILFVFLISNLVLDYQKDTRAIEGGLLCQNETCEAKDPKDTGCAASALTSTSTTISFSSYGQDFENKRVELRHSKSCNASWAKGFAPNGSFAYVEDVRGKIVGDEVKLQEFYTDMLPGETKRRACVKPPSGEAQCTDFVNPAN